MYLMKSASLSALLNSMMDGGALFKDAGTHDLVNIADRVFIQKPDGIGIDLGLPRFLHECS